MKVKLVIKNLKKDLVVLETRYKYGQRYNEPPISCEFILGEYKKPEHTLTEKKHGKFDKVITINAEEV